MIRKLKRFLTDILIYTNVDGAPNLEDKANLSTSLLGVTSHK